MQYRAATRKQTITTLIQLWQSYQTSLHLEWLHFDSLHSFIQKLLLLVLGRLRGWLQVHDNEKRHSHVDEYKSKQTNTHTHTESDIYFWWTDWCHSLALSQLEKWVADLNDAQGVLKYWLIVTVNGIASRHNFHYSKRYQRQFIKNIEECKCINVIPANSIGPMEPQHISQRLLQSMLDDLQPYIAGWGGYNVNKVILWEYKWPSSSASNMAEKHPNHMFNTTIQIQGIPQTATATQTSEPLFICI